MARMSRFPVKLAAFGMAWMFLFVVIAPSATADSGPFGSGSIDSFTGEITGATCTGEYHFEPPDEVEAGAETSADDGVMLIIVLVLIGLRVATLFAPTVSGGERGDLHWTYACEVNNMRMTTVGSEGQFRRVSIEGWDKESREYVEMGIPCTYNGISDSGSCPARAFFNEPTPAGGESGIDEYPYGSVPQTVDVCISPKAQAVNAPQHRELEAVAPSTIKKFSDFNGEICLAGVDVTWEESTEVVRTVRELLDGAL